MSKTCLSCGAPLSDTAKFCKSCGTSVAAASPSTNQVNYEMNAEGRRCVKCATSLSQTAKFCKRCGTPAISEKTTPKGANLNRKGDHTSAKNVMSTVQQAIGTVMASSSPGDCILGVGSPPVEMTSVAAQVSSAAKALSPFKVLIGGLITAIKGIGSARKDKKALLTAIMFAAGWLVLTLLPALGISVPAWLNFLTFARGGLTGGIAGFVGGILGKCLFVSLIVGILSGNGQFKIKKGIKTTGQNMKPPNSLGLTLAGVGLALVLYNFMTGDNSPQNSMVGIVAAVAAIRSQGQSGFLRQFAVSLSSRLSKTILPSNAQTGHLSAGFAAGFALGVPLSLLGVSWVCYLLGSLTCVTGAILSIKAANGVKAA